MPGRQFVSSSTYRYGFNGKENDNEVKGVNGSSVDFGARMYDPRLGRWMSVDSKAAKFSSESPYCFVSNNPIIFIDPDGDEKIIVIGGADKEGADAMKFVNTGLLKLNDLTINGGKENITIVVTDIYMWKKVKDQLNKAVKNVDSKYKGQVSVVYINNGDELTHYINSKSTKSEKLSEARKDDPITEVDFYGHGYRPDYSSQGDQQGSFEPAHCDKCGGEQMSGNSSNRPEHTKWAWGKTDVDALHPEAFSDNATIDYTGICNAATPNSKEVATGKNPTNLAKYTAEKIPGSKVKGWYGRSNYVTIYDPKAAGKVSNPYGKSNGVGPAKSYPTAGSKYSGGSSEVKTYNGKTR